MPQLTAAVTATNADPFGAGMVARLRKLNRANNAVMAESARTATRVTRDGFKYKRDIAPPRAGRSSTGGQMRDALRWEVLNGGVEFDVKHADTVAPHWIIQEIGTGESAVLRKPDASNPVGRPKAGASYVRRVPSQIGRRLPGGLVFASGGTYTPTGQGGSHEQIHLASQVLTAKGKRLPRGIPGIRIGREIKPQHMVRDGGIAGFRQYRTSVLAAAREAFK